MSPQAVREHWARIPREVILRAMAPDQCLDSRLRHAMILWSWCGPEKSDAVVRKDAKGWIVRDGAGKPIPAQLKDLGELLGIPSGNKAVLTRTAKALIGQKMLRLEGKVMYLIPKPPTFESTGSVDMHVNWNFGTVDVHDNQLPSDPVDRQTALAWLEEQHATFKTERNQFNARWRELIRSGASAVGILIDEKKKSLRAMSGRAGESSEPESAATVNAETPARPPASSIAETLRTWLVNRFDLPAEPDEEILARIGAHIPDAAALERFKRAAANRKPHKWALFVHIAADCAARHAAKTQGVETPSATQSSRDRAVNELITYLVDLENPELDEQARTRARAKLEQAPPDLLSEARRLYGSLPASAAR